MYILSYKTGNLQFQLLIEIKSERRGPERGGGMVPRKVKRLGTQEQTISKNKTKKWLQKYKISIKNNAILGTNDTYPNF